MIIGNVKQWQQEVPYLPEWLAPWIEKLAALDTRSLTTGRHELGGKHYMNVDESVTEPAENRRLEEHLLYADVQFVLEGDEIIGYQPVCQVGPMIDKNEERDNYFFSSDAADDAFIHMTPGTYAVFLPGDAHRPLIAPDGKGGPVRKIVMKIYL